MYISDISYKTQNKTIITLHSKAAHEELVNKLTVSVTFLLGHPFNSCFTIGMDNSILIVSFI